MYDFTTKMETRNHTTLYKLQSIIKERLGDAMPLPCWVTAEISELKVNYSGHCYIELVEKGGDNRIPCARASAMAWRSTWGALESYFRSETGTDLAVGMNIMLRVSVNYHELYGLSLVISDIDPLYTLGDMERQRQQTIARLQEEGVFDMNRSLGLPPVVQRIAVVSSRNAAGYQDFMNELGISGYRFDVTLFDAFMQGQGAESSIIEALGAAAERQDEFDAAVIIRGGGSVSDLAAFDSYRLCSHIAQFPLPVITGIGHDKDESVADLVAAYPVKTPTAAAAFLVSALAEFDGWLDTLQNAVTEEAVSLLDTERRRLREAGHVLSQTLHGFTRALEIRLERLSGELIRRQQNNILGNRNKLATLETALKERTGRLLSAEKTRLATAGKIIEGRRPEKVLSLGFAIVRSGGKAVTNSAGLTTDATLEITLARGSATAKVTKINK